MRTADFDYELPPERIAQAPLHRRDQARMMVLDATTDAPPEHACVADLPRWLRPNDLLVVNDTKVIPARLTGHWADTKGAVELLLVEPLDDQCWQCLCRSGRPVRPGGILCLAQGELTATVLAPRAAGGAGITVRFDSQRPLEAILEQYGRVPLPPYIRRDAPEDERDAHDRDRYQTVYAQRPGAVAAPTAGLHFTPELLQRLADAGVQRATLTLHVGPGTFRPVSSDRIEQHVMDAERFEVPPETAQAIRTCRAAGGRVVAVGSTCVRTLETMAAKHAGEPTPCTGRSRLFIHPPYPFRMVDAMLTNFHLPRSTLLMMIAAFAGTQRVLAAYREAVAREYRFYSYGDCMLLT